MNIMITDFRIQVWEQDKMQAKYYLEDLKGRDRSEDLGVRGKIMSKGISGT
jgi:hypothetical protein